MCVSRPAPHQSPDTDSRNTAPYAAAAQSPLTLLVPHLLGRRPPVPVDQLVSHQVAIQVRVVVVLEWGPIVQHRAVVEQDRFPVFELAADPKF